MGRWECRPWVAVETGHLAGFCASPVLWVNTLRAPASLEVVNRVAEYKLRAERRLGEVQAEMPKATGTRVLGRPKLGSRGKRPRKKRTPTLAELGISKDLSSRAQKLAAVPEEVFELTNHPAGYNMCGIEKNKPLTITEVARRGGLSTLKKYGRKKMRQWGKRGGRPPNKKR